MLIFECVCVCVCVCVSFQQGVTLYFENLRHFGFFSPPVILYTHVFMCHMDVITDVYRALAPAIIKQQEPVVNLHVDILRLASDHMSKIKVQEIRAFPHDV